MKKNIIFHPWLFALVPILGLFEHNQDIASAYYLPKPMLLNLLFVTALFFILNIFIKNKNKSAIVVSLFIISFFFFDLLLILLFSINSILPLGAIFYDALSLLIYIITILGLSFVIITSPYQLNNPTIILNFFAGVVLFLQLINIANYQYQNIKNQSDASNLITPLKTTTKTENITNEKLPDIYYIILDAYGREDTLKNIYNYDNSNFISFLEDKGFYVAKKSQANYNQTFLSMASSLNINYIDDLVENIDTQSSDRAILKKILKENITQKYLKERGYFITSFPSQWEGIYKNTQADLTITTNLKQNNFDAMLIKKTPLVLFLPAIQIKDLAIYTNNVLGQIPAIAKIDKPTFSYIHILAPHTPFLFEADGQIANSISGCMEGTDGSHYFASCPGIEKYQKKYIAQLAYINQKIENIINELLEKSDIPPIIILQADHGPGSMLDWDSAENTNLPERFQILNAYYVPEQNKKMLYSSISPVNSFRIIFNYLFQDNLPLLEDRHFFATWSKPYQFIDISEKLIQSPNEE